MYGYEWEDSLKDLEPGGCWAPWNCFPGSSRSGSSADPASPGTWIHR